MPSPKPTLLFVDGYNVIGAHPSLQHIRDEVGLEEARRQLGELLINYSAEGNYETELVFDAHYQDRPGIKEPLSDRVHVAYTPFQQTADSYIEWACAQFFRHDLRRFDQRLVVATSDRAQWLTAVGYGADWMSSLKLVNQALTSAERSRQHHRAKRGGRRFLGQSIDASAQDKLARLRQELFNQGG